MSSQKPATESAAVTREQAVKARRPLRYGTAAIVLVFCVAAIGVAMRMFWPKRAVIPEAATFRVRRGPLRITVSEGGTIQAERIERIRSEVQRSVTILYLIPEGTIITEEDVKNGRVLVEMDSSELVERQTRQEITVQNVTADLTKAREDFEIRLNQNESNIQAAELKAKFARLELEHYLGKELAQSLSDKTDFASLRSDSRLGGDALRQKIERETRVHLAEEEVQRAADRLEWTQRLYDKKFVTRNELMADELALKRRQAEYQQEKYGLELYLEYELRKQAETLFADWREKVLELERVKARARSEEAQALAKLKSAEATAELERQQLQKLTDQVAACTIRATRPGLVVYASSTNAWARTNNPIQEGVSVRERQEIIHLPDLNSLVAELKIHESRIKQIVPGQRAVITVDAMPELRLTGTVKDVAGLPDPQHWMQDAKVFTTIVSIEGDYRGLKPGMSCRAEITVGALEDVCYVPVQTVTARGRNKVCYVVTPTGSEMRIVETGLYDDRYVEIKSGLSAGEAVMLNPPVLPGEEEGPKYEEEEAETAAAAPAEPKPQQPATETTTTAQGTPPQDSRADFMVRMRKAGITMDDLRRWRSEGMTEDDVKKLKAAGLQDAEIERLKSGGSSGGSGAGGVSRPEGGRFGPPSGRRGPPPAPSSD
jgi:HlyD family secretion protein